MLFLEKEKLNEKECIKKKQKKTKVPMSLGGGGVGIFGFFDQG